jgi:hypothetical protein
LIGLELILELLIDVSLDLLQRERGGDLIEAGQAGLHDHGRFVGLVLANGQLVDRQAGELHHHSTFAVLGDFFS